MKFYVYRWFNISTNFTFYVGKGCKKRYKSKSKRNKLFLKYISENECSSEIISYFETEQEAFEEEALLIKKYKSIGECICNIDSGGHGGVNFSWTEEMRKYKSEFNPMKETRQKERMSKSNPMKDKRIAELVAQKTRKKPIIDGVLYENVYDCAKHFGVHVQVIRNWCKRGYSTNFLPCKYENEKYKTPQIPDRHNRKTVIIDSIEFRSVKEGAEYLNCDPSVLIRCIKSGKPYKKIHICKYGNQQPRRVKSDNSNP